jgi:ketosteroid isomerase-like protein
VISSEPNSERAERFFEALEGRDLRTWIGLFSSDAEMEFPFHPRQLNPNHAYSSLNGRARIERLMGDALEKWEAVSFDDVVVRPTLDPDVVCVECSGEFIVVGREVPYRNKFITMLFFSDGQIVRWREYMDPLPLIEVEGMTPADVDIEYGGVA